MPNFRAGGMNKLIFTVLIGLALVSVGLAQGKDSLAVSIDKADSVVSASDTEKTIPDSLIFWKNGGSFNINIQQVGLKNWAAGGNASVAVGGRIEAFANYEEGDVVWENNFKAGYGVIRNGGVGNDFEKTDDLIILRSKYSQKFSERVLMSATVDFRTQMDRGFKNEAGQNGEQVRTLISDFMAPGYLQASLGLTFREEQVFRVTLAPFTGRFTFVLDSALSAAGAFGVEPNEKIRSEAGISLNGQIRKGHLGKCETSDQC